MSARSRRAEVSASGSRARPSRAGGPSRRPHAAGRPRLYSEEAITALLTRERALWPRAARNGGLRALAGRVRPRAAGARSHDALAPPRAARRAAAGDAGPTRRSIPSSTPRAGAGRGEGSWRRHRWRRGVRLTWKRHYVRVHLGVDEATGGLRALGVGTMSVTDGEMLPDLLTAVAAPLRQVTGDGSYDQWGCYDAVAARPDRPRAVFPPPRPRAGPNRARVRRHGNAAAPRLDRDEHVRCIRRVGRRRWKAQVGYHRRSLAETAVARYKRRFGERVTARTFAGQCADVFLRGASSTASSGSADRLVPGSVEPSPSLGTPGPTIYAPKPLLAVS